MSERRTLAVAGAAHLGLLAALSLGWSAMTKPQPVPDAVAVDLLDISDTPKASAEAREATAPPPTPAPRAEPQPAPDPTPPPPLPTISPRAAPPEPVPDAVTEAPAPPPKPARRMKPPKPAPDPDQLAKSLDAALGPTPKPKLKPRAQADPKQLASLLDRALAPAPPHAKPGPQQTAQPAHAAFDARAQASLVQAIRAQIIPCWNVPAGSEGMTVDLHIRLAKDGSVSGPVDIRSQTGGANAMVARAFAESAKRAVSRCAPLKLPAALYEQWHDIDPLHFDPKDVT